MPAVQFALEAPKRSSLSSTFSDRSFQGTYNPESKTVTGTILDGEDEPEYVIAMSLPSPASRTFARSRAHSVGKVDFKKLARNPNLKP